MVVVVVVDWVGGGGGKKKGEGGVLCICEGDGMGGAVVRWDYIGARRAKVWYSGMFSGWV